MRNTGFLRAFFTLIIVFGLVAVLLFATGVLKFPEQNTGNIDNGNIAGETGQTEVAGEEFDANVDAVPVTTSLISRDNVFYVETSGITDALTQIPVFAGSAAQVKGVLVNEGDMVDAGDPLLVLGGTNDANHPLIYQLEIALQNYDTAQKSYNNAIDSANAAVRSAELQVENAINQTEGFRVDDQVFANSYKGLKDSEGVAGDTLIETRIKNERDIENLKDSIDDMEDALNQLEKQRDSGANSYADQYADLNNDIIEGALNLVDSYTAGQIDSQIAQMEQQIKTSKAQLETLQSGAILGENQLLGQMMQVENQQHTLLLNRESANLKMGIDGDTSTSIKLAEQGLAAAKVQGNSLLTQAESQLDMAKINLDSVQDQVDGLTVKSPVTGVVSKMSAKAGALVSPQMAVAEVTNERSYVLKASINAEDAARVVPGAKAEVKLGNRYVRLPIQSISSVANPTSKLVAVTIELPNVKFTANQILEVRIPVSPSRGGNSYFVPLDAVTIGSQEQFLFVNENGVAKRVIVELGEISGDLVEIRTGLSGGEEIIIKGAKELADGQAIDIKN